MRESNADLAVAMEVEGGKELRDCVSARQLKERRASDTTG
jgi:hypothetical protein